MSAVIQAIDVSDTRIKNPAKRMAELMGNVNNWKQEGSSNVIWFYGPRIDFRTLSDAMLSASVRGLASFRQVETVGPDEEPIFIGVTKIDFSGQLPKDKCDPKCTRPCPMRIEPQYRLVNLEE